MPRASRQQAEDQVGIALGIAGITGLGLGGVFGGIASSHWSDAQSTCASKTNCRSRPEALSDRSTALGLATASTIAFIARRALVVGGVVLWITAPSSRMRRRSVAGSW